jgi:hypothetical protein
MQRAEIVWTYDDARQAMVAHIDDAEGRAWTATIQPEPFGFGSRIVAVLICRPAGRVYSTNTRASVEDAKQWCYETLDRV